MHYTEAAGHGWQFVPTPGVAPLPRYLSENEYYPLHVRLTAWEKEGGCRCRPKYPHKHIEFMGDDGVASVWAPIESKPFLDHVLTWIGSRDEFLYDAGIEHIRTALKEQRAELLDELTEREQALIDDPAKWNRPATSYWCS